MAKLSENARQNKHEYDKQYIRQNIQSKHLAFNKLIPEDMELFEWCNSQQESANFYIKRLIREDMERQKGKKDV